MMKALWVMMIVTTLVIMFIFFYAFIIMTSEQAVKVAGEVETVVPLPEPKVVDKEVNQVPDDQGEDFEDPVIFSFNRNDPSKLHELALKYNGMDNLDAMDRYLLRSDYISILKRLWTENDQDKRYNWLEEKRPESHPLLLFELALETIKQDPSLKGFTRALFLLELAKDRTEMDTACVADSSAEVAANSLYQIYAKSVADVVKNNPGLYDEVQNASKQELSKTILEQLLKALKEAEVNLNRLPSPSWTSQHALKTLFSNQNVMVDTKTCRQKQEVILKAMISKTELQLQGESSQQRPPVTAEDASVK